MNPRVQEERREALRKRLLIAKELRGLPDGWSVLLETRAENALEVALAALRVMTDKGYRGIVVSATRPYANLSGLYRESDIDLKRVFVIDCISKSQNPRIVDADNVHYLDGVSVTSVGVSLHRLMDTVHGGKFLLLDSINTLLIHNQPDIFAKFIHSTLSRLRMNKVNCILLSFGGERTQEVRAEVAQLCDKVIAIP
ncbi:MAG: hypothetical protein HY558_01670 [Euryarchaeota archaeon]|nr:hypothetical protein [Euryarchaeota archaeon]